MLLDMLCPCRHVVPREDENLYGCVGAGMPALCEVLPDMQGDHGRPYERE